MPRRLLPSTTQPEESPEPIVMLWMSRIITRLGGYKKFIGKDGFENDDVAACLGLEHWLDPDGDDFDQRLVRSELWRICDRFEAQYAPGRLSEPLGSNLTRLAHTVGLDETEQWILAFLVQIRCQPLLTEVSDWLGKMTTARSFSALAAILGVPQTKVRNTLSAGGRLIRSGLVYLDRRDLEYLEQKLDLLSESFADTMLSIDSDPISLIGDYVSPGPLPELNLTDYQHINRELNILRLYLEGAIKESRKGVNILLQGLPGTGKTELTRVLAQEYECHLYEVASGDEDDIPISGGDRLRAYRIAQNFLSRGQSLILFDEVEDVFDDGMSHPRSRNSTARTKGWINRLLEENPTPAFWLTNSVSCLDPAFIRRFDIVLELPIPPRSQRRRILRKHCGAILNNSALERVASTEPLAPAVATQAASVVDSIRSHLSDNQAGEAFELIVNNTLKTQGHDGIVPEDSHGRPEFYDPAFINVDFDLNTLLRGIRENPTARLCLYGPPGTGKTAWAHWLADALDRPFMSRRGSDLLSMWVGGTEQNLAAAFRTAEKDEAILLIDEVDGFLRDRRQAHQQWEVTGVNEMLTAMESFKGIFIASTNLIDGLDQASLRRFDLKLYFDYLATDQASALLRYHCKTMGLPLPAAYDLERLAGLANLTPGDFAAVLRRHRFSPLRGVDEIVEALEQECDLKEDHSRPIGFIH